MQEWKKKRKTMHHYDHVAPFYNAQYAEEQKAKIETALRNTNLKEGALILDMGCGTGILFPYIANSAKLLLGIDTSPKILQEAKKRAKQLPNTAILRADADYTPFQNQTFDHIFAITLLQNMPNPLKTLQETKRISKPRSTIIITGLKKKFTERAFTELLKKAELKITTLETNTNLKGHVAICQNRK